MLSLHIQLFLLQFIDYYVYIHTISEFIHMIIHFIMYLLVILFSLLYTPYISESVRLMGRITKLKYFLNTVIIHLNDSINRLHVMTSDPLCVGLFTQELAMWGLKSPASPHADINMFY